MRKGILENLSPLRVQPPVGEVSLQEAGSAIMHGRGTGHHAAGGHPDVQAEELHDPGVRAVLILISGRDNPKAEGQKQDQIP